MPTQHGGLPIVWQGLDGEQFGQAPADPNDIILATAAPADTAQDIHVFAYTATDRTREYGRILLPSGLHIPATGTITLKPYVHWTFVAEPTNGQTVIWQMAYVVAKPDAAFAAAPTILTASTYTADADVEVRVHLQTALGDIAINVADAAPNLAVLYTILLDDDSTVADNNVATLGVRWYAQVNPIGTTGVLS